MTNPADRAPKKPEEVFAHLRALEERLLDPAVRRSPHAVGALLADEFVEFGTSGGVYDKEWVLEALADERPSLRYSASDFQFVELGPDTIQVRFRTTTKDSDSKTETHALRSSIWKLTNGTWRMTFHQGTRTARPAATP
jgi:hypothetical protein